MGLLQPKSISPLTEVDRAGFATLTSLISKFCHEHDNNAASNSVYIINNVNNVQHPHTKSITNLPTENFSKRKRSKLLHRAYKPKRPKIESILSQTSNPYSSQFWTIAIPSNDASIENSIPQNAESKKKDVEARNFRSSASLSDLETQDNGDGGDIGELNTSNTQFSPSLQGTPNSADSSSSSGATKINSATITNSPDTTKPTSTINLTKSKNVANNKNSETKPNNTEDESLPTCTPPTYDVSSESEGDCEDWDKTPDHACHLLLALYRRLILFIILV